MTPESPVAFTPSAEISVGRGRQLYQSVEPPPPTTDLISSKARAVAVSEDCLDSGADASPYAGVTFQLAGGDRCFERVVVGLSRKNDRAEDLDFGVRICRDRLCGVAIGVEESGVEVCQMTCDGDERVTIRLDSTRSCVEYLLDDALIYTSTKVARLPFCCKVVNIITRNIMPNQYPLPQRWSMRLPVKSLRWITVFMKVLTPRVVGRSDDGSVITSLTSLAGNEFVRIETVPKHTIAVLRHALTAMIDGETTQLCFLSEDGKILADTDDWPQ